MILDVNVLLYAVDAESRNGDACRRWIEAALGGGARVGFPWPTILSFVRISTHPRIMERPLGPEEAWSFIDDWLACPVAWIPAETPRHLETLKRLTSAHNLSGNLIPDAHLATLAIEHGVPVVSCDTDFARFGEPRWINPLSS